MFTCVAKILLLASVCVYVNATLHRRVPKQIDNKAAAVVSEADNNPAETHFGGGAEHHGGHGKYFMYQHVPHKDHYEFGYRRGNEHHFKERYEKAQPHHGHFKTKARWGDKHGGYGEHYWDYNHGGHHGDDEGSSDDEGDGSENVPNYHPTDVAEDRVKRQHQDHQHVLDAASTTATPSLVYDQESDTVLDEATGRRYLLTPIN